MVKTEKMNRVLWITLNNPETSNSINYEMIDQLVSYLEKAEVDPEIRVAVITGKGKTFAPAGI